MKPIKTPIRMSKQTETLWEGDSLLCTVGGGYQMARKRGAEIVQALNYHDQMKAICEMAITADNQGDDESALYALFEAAKQARDLLAEMEATE